MAANQDSSDTLLKQAIQTMQVALSASLTCLLAIDTRAQAFINTIAADDSNGDTLRRFTQAVMLDETLTRNLSFSMQREAALLNAVLRSNEPIAERPVNKIAQLKGGGMLAHGADAVHAQTMSLLPLSDGPRPLGVILLLWQRPPNPKAYSAELLQALTQQLIVALSAQHQLNDLKRREAQARSSVKFYETVVNIAGSGMFLLNSEDRIIFANKHVKKLLGYTDAELLNRPLRDLFHIRNRGDDAQAVQMEVGGTVTFEKYLIRSDDDALPVMMTYVPPPETDGNIDNVVVITDLSDLKDREIALMRRTRQLSAINEAARVISSSLDYATIPSTILAQAVQVVGAEAGSITLVEDNSRDLVFRAAVGPGSDGILGMRVPFGQGVVGHIAKTAEPTLVKDVRRDQRFYTKIDATSGLVTRSLIGVPLLVKRNVLGVLEVINKQNDEFDEEDLSLMTALAQWAAIAIDNARLYNDLVTRARDLENANRELREADRLKNEMIQNISHELRTPLMHIIGYLDMQLTGYFGELTPDLHDSLTVVRRKTAVLDRLISDIVTLQTMAEDKLQREPVQLVQLANQALQGVRPSAEESQCVLRLVASSELPPVYVDADRIEQVLDNLLMNAIKFSPNGGNIEVHMRDLPTSVQVAVIDQGVGISEAHMPRIFQRFFQGDGSTTRRFGGLGLGLSICHDIVLAHGGDIWAESEEGKGTRMFFTVPKVSAVQIPIGMERRQTGRLNRPATPVGPFNNNA